MNERDRVQALLLCSLIVETSKTIKAAAEKSERLGREIADCLELLREPVVVDLREVRERAFFNSQCGND